MTEKQGADLSEPSIQQRFAAALAKTRGYSTEKLRAFIHVSELVTSALGLRLAEVRESPDPIAHEFADQCHRDLKATELAEALDITLGLLGRLLARLRMPYADHERFRIVLHMRKWNLPLDDAARRFCVSRSTLSRWLADADENPDKTTIGKPLLRAQPPLQTKADWVRAAVHLLDDAKIGGNLKIAQFFERLGTKLGRETIRNIRKARHTGRPATPTPTLPTGDAQANRPVRADYPNHIWMADITDVPTVFRLITLKLVVLIDVYSRFPLAFQVFWQEPTGGQVAELFHRAVERFKPPKYFLSDQGRQFKEGAFPEALHDMSVVQRFGALGTHGSIAIIERLWRTTKDALDLRLLYDPLGRGHLAEMIDRFLFHYATIRPHQRFGGATPAERYFGIESPTVKAVRAPRAGSTNSARTAPLRIVFLDRERRLPVAVLEKLAA